MSDAALVAAARGGNREAFAALVDRHQPLLLALCQRALGDPVLSEDAVQEAALTAFLNLDRLRSADRFGPWLGGIGLNICHRLVRQRSRDGWSWEAVQGGRREREIATPEPGPEEVSEAADLAARTRDAIAGLPPGQRSAVVLFYLSGLTHAETADLLGITVGAVKTRLHKARQTLKRQLSELETEGEQAMDERVTRRTVMKTAAVLPVSAATGYSAGASGAPDQGAGMVEAQGAALVAMRVIDVRRKHAKSGLPANHVVLLEEVGGTRRLPIWVGEPEGAAIAIQREDVQMPRPLAVAFAANLLQAAGGTLREVHIDRLVDNVFYATAIIEGNEGSRTVDARPSDAIALALVTGAAIRVDPAILETGSPGADLLHELPEGQSEIVAEVIAGWPAPSSSTAG